jgi:hypothetical protein
VSNISPQHIAANIGAIFSQLNQQEVEEFYIGYQYWSLQRKIENLQIRLGDFRKQIIENTERIQEVQPTAIELATLARLQSNGVSDVDLLDRMLERGESWLDRTMQRLDYLEHLDDFISDDYTQWCQNALEGAYDWIDTVLDGNVTSQPSTETTSSMLEDVKEEELIEATEELFLQKISIDEDEALMQEITMKRPVLSYEEHLLEEETTILDAEQPSVQEFVEVSSATKDSPSTSLETPQQSIEHAISEVISDRKEIEAQSDVNIPEAREQHKNKVTKRPGFISRCIAKIWGS